LLLAAYESQPSEEISIVRLFLSLHVVLVLSFCCSFVGAASPASETLFPNGTKGWVSIPDADLLHKQFGQTQLGALVKDPLMQKFMDDLHEQLRDKLNDTGVKLGVTLADLDGVHGGEIAFGLIQPDAKDPLSHALALVVDVTGKHPAAAALLVKIEKNLAAKGAVKKQLKSKEQVLTQFTLPVKAGAKLPEHAVYVLHGDTLIVSDQLVVVEAMLARFAPATDCLEKLPAFSFVNENVAAEAKQLAPELRWFIDPLGFAETNRAANGGRKKKGIDPLTVLRKSGFGELQGLGGYLNFSTAQHETLYRTFMYSPTINAPKVAGKKALPAEGMLDFPNGANLSKVQPWVPFGVSTYLTWNWKMAKAFNNFGPLFDGFTEPGTFDEILEGLEKDPAGPEINIRSELIATLGERVTLITDYKLPINEKCERVLVAFELQDGQDKAALEAIRKLVKAEPNARKLTIEGHEVWEIADRDEEAEAILPPMVEGAGFLISEPPLEVAHLQAAAPGAPPAGIVVTVNEGNIFVGSHTDIVADVLKARPAAGQLGGSKDYMQVDEELVGIGSKLDCMRFYTRTDEAYRPTYELIQQGRLPKAETLLARALNQMIDAGKKGAVRKAVIDGKNMPEYQKISNYFGPGGFYMQARPQGWFIGGCLLKNPAAAVANKPAK
jgi:hypothetical protein